MMLTAACRMAAPLLRPAEGAGTVLRPLAAARPVLARHMARLTGAPPLHPFKGDESHENIDGLEPSVEIDGRGKLAVIFGGFGMKEKQMKRHEELYHGHGFDTLPVQSTVRQLTTPAWGPERGKMFAEQIQAYDKDVTLHLISGSFWTAMFLLEEMDPEFREKRIRAIVFDSCPPRTDIYAFGGWLCYALQLDPAKWQSLASHLFHPYRWIQQINETFNAENDRRMKTLVPRDAHILFMHGRNDPVLDTQYVSTYAQYLRERTRASCVELLFEKSRHSMAVVDYPQLYKATHVNRFLAHVPGWRIEQPDP